MMSLSQITSCYDSCNSPVLSVIRVGSVEMESLNKVYYSIRRYCNTELDAPSEFIFSLWRIHYYMNNSISSYDVISEFMHEEIKKIQDVYWATSFLKDKIGVFIDIVKKLSASKSNKKLEELTNLFGASDSSQSLAVCHKLFSFSEVVNNDEAIMRKEPFSAYLNLSRSSDLEFSFDKVFCLTPIQFLGDKLFRKLFHAGYCKEISLFLYPRETYRLPSRLSIDSSKCYESIIANYRLSVVSFDHNLQSSAGEIDNEQDDLWSLFHGGQRTQLGNLVQAIFIVLDTGEGTFLALNSKVPVIRAVDIAIKEPRISKISPRLINEGDYICLKFGDTEEELDRLTVIRSEEVDSQNGLICIDDWREALESLSLTKTSIEISRDISSESKVRITPAQVTQWVSGSVIGPRDPQILAATISFLVREQVLDLKQQSVLDASRALWDEMSNFRAGRVKAGHSIQKTNIDKVEALISNPNFDFESADLAKGFFFAHQYLVSRVSALDDNAAFVPASKINFIDKFGSLSWLG